MERIEGRSPFGTARWPHVAPALVIVAVQMPRPTMAGTRSNLRRPLRLFASRSAGNRHQLNFAVLPKPGVRPNSRSLAAIDRPTVATTVADLILRQTLVPM
jgi:hypothetical protein